MQTLLLEAGVVKRNKLGTKKVLFFSYINSKDRIIMIPPANIGISFLCILKLHHHILVLINFTLVVKNCCGLIKGKKTVVKCKEKQK